MTNTELRAKIVEMLNCDEINDLQYIPYGIDLEYKIDEIETQDNAIQKYEEVIAFILNELEGINE